MAASRIHMSESQNINVQPTATHSDLSSLVKLGYTFIFMLNFLLISPIKVHNELKDIPAKKPQIDTNTTNANTSMQQKLDRTDIPIQGQASW